MDNLNNLPGVSNPSMEMDELERGEGQFRNDPMASRDHFYEVPTPQSMQKKGWNISRNRGSCSCINIFLLILVQVLLCVIAGFVVFYFIKSPSTSDGGPPPAEFSSTETVYPPRTSTHRPSLTQAATATSSTTESTTTTTTITQTPTSRPGGPYRDCGTVCNDVISNRIESNPIGFATAGANVTIEPNIAGIQAKQVYCDCSDPNKAWTVFQRRMDGSEDFNRNWNEYANGFGDILGEFWLGLEFVSKFTGGDDAELRIDLKNWQQDTAHVEYETFSISGSATGYYLTSGGHSGTAGDSLSIHNGLRFSTTDRDNGNNGPSNCATMWEGAWWYSNCAISLLNGRYNDQIFWTSWNSGMLIATEMKVRRK